MKYLITGAGGFIGGYLYRRILDNAEEKDIVVGTSRKADKCYEPGKPNGIYNSQLESSRWVDRLVSDLKPDVIFHFAGCATISSSAQSIWKSNVDTTLNLLDAISNVKYDRFPKFILASSINARNNISPYAASKVAAEALVNAYTYQEYIVGMPIRFCAVAGAYNTHGAVRDIIRKILTVDNPEVFGNYPGSKKPFLFVNDLVDIIMEITDNLNIVNSLRFGSITVCPVDTISIADIINIVKKETGISKDVSFSGKTWKGDVNYVSPPDEIKYLNRYSKLKPPLSYSAVEKAVRQTLEKEYEYRVSVQ